MSFGKLIYIVVFARLRQLSGQIRKDVEDFLSENIGGDTAVPPPDTAPSEAATGKGRPEAPTDLVLE